VPRRSELSRLEVEQSAGGAEADSAAVLAIRDLVVEFPVREGVVTAVDSVSLEIGAGRRIGVVGESGSGKSTLALSILGLLEPPARIPRGEIRFGGVDLVRASPETLRSIRGGQIAMIFQDALGSLNPVLTIGRQLREAIRLHDPVSVEEATVRSIRLLREVGVASPEQRLRQFPHEFSGGMRQRVMIAMALACDPKLLIADEPTTALDVTTQAGVIDLLKRLSEERRMAVILITHDLGLVAGFADEVLVMYAGAPMEYASVDELFARPRHPYTRSLMAAIPTITDRRAQRLASIPGSLPPAHEHFPGCRFEPRCPLGRGRERCLHERPAFDLTDPALRAACHYSDEALLRQPGHDADLVAAPPAAEAAEQATLLRVRELVKTYAVSRGARREKRRLRAVDGVSFDILTGESLGLVGESGSGKSTIARLVLGLFASDAGRIEFRGQKLGSVRQRAHSGQRGQIQMIFQDPADSLNPMLTVERIVGEPLLLRERQTLRSLRPRVLELLGLVGLAPSHARRLPGELSGGQRQRVAIARALATNPALIACDEAVSSLDVSVRAQILNLLMDLQAQLGLSYLYISHDLSVVRHICDRVAVMYAGKIVELADADAVFSSPQHPYTVALLSAVPIADPVRERVRRHIRLDGDPPDLTQPLAGCPFRSRCWKAQELCATEAPLLAEHAAAHWSACHFPERPAVRPVPS
jgi:peptide/nickel transport system ATP-binding protein